jgi:hypothetical protein
MSTGYGSIAQPLRNFSEENAASSENGQSATSETAENSEGESGGDKEEAQQAGPSSSGQVAVPALQTPLGHRGARTCKASELDHPAANFLWAIRPLHMGQT